MRTYRLKLELYPKPEWRLREKKTRKLSTNDIAAGFPDHSWVNEIKLSTRILTTAFKAATDYAESKGGSYVIEVHREKD